MVVQQERIVNLTCTACISRNAVEAIRFFDEGGTTHENYSDYFGLLLEQMMLRFPGKKLLFVADNGLAA